MSGRRLRTARLEAAQAAWNAEHLPLSEVLGVLHEVLSVIGEEAGPDVAGRVAGRMIATKAQKVDALSRGKR